MRTLFVLAPLALLSGAGMGQEKLATPAQEAATTSEKKLAALIERFEKQDTEALDAYSKASEAHDEAEKSKALARRPGKGFIPEFRALAEEAQGTETAARAWLWVLRLIGNDPKESKRIVDLLLEQHMQSEALGELTDRVRDREALRAMVDESPHERVRAGALLALGKLLLDSAKSEDKAEGRDCLEAVVSEYGELSYGQDSTFAAAADRHLFELDRLQLGMVAPDFEATDENGVQWKLSDYRGKVVVVDFWGNW
ncbi:MAG: redoxin domain-containing protein [Planctomycetes bacterium]|nr:redoxin domain-containing protein [Planctomycetota bacterium]